jgi:hypothetical protein
MRGGRVLAGLAVAAAIATAGATQASQSVGPDTVFNRLKAFFHEHDLDAPFQSAEPLGDDGILFKNISVAAKEPAAEGQAVPSLTIDSLAVRGLAPLGKDGFSASAYDIGKIAIDFPMDAGATLAVRIEPSGGTGLYMVPTDSMELPFSPTTPTTFKLGALTALLGGQEVFAMSGAESSVWFDESGDLLTMKSSMPQARIPLEALPAAARTQLRALGMEKLSVAISSSGAWNMPAGRMTVHEYRIEVAGAGAVTLSLALEGYTLEWYRRVRASAQRAQEAGTDNVDAQKQAATEMMTAMGELKLASLKLDFRDGAITRRLLAMQAEAMGTTPEELAASVPLMLAEFLALARNPQFSTGAAEAIKAFLADPGAISLTIAPPAPVPVTDIVGAVLNGPEKLVPMLNAQVTAAR